METGEEHLSAHSESERNGLHDNTPAKEELKRLRTQLLTLQATVKPRRRIPGLDFAECWALEDLSAKYVPYVVRYRRHRTGGYRHLFQPLPRTCPSDMTKPEFHVGLSASVRMETASSVELEDPRTYRSVKNSSGDGKGGRSGKHCEP